MRIPRRPVIRFAASWSRNYTLLAIPDGTSVEWTEINVLQRFIAQAKPVQVQAGDESKVTIKLQQVSLVPYKCRYWCQ